MASRVFVIAHIARLRSAPPETTSRVACANRAVGADLPAGSRNAKKAFSIWSSPCKKVHPGLRMAMKRSLLGRVGFAASSAHHDQILHCRRFGTTGWRQEQHLLWAGTLLDESSPVHKPLNQDLFLAAGAGQDIAEGGITLLPPAGSPVRGHSLLPYRTAAPENAVTKVFAIGRNSMAQLGVGFASQEATFGLVRPGFGGAGAVRSVLAAQAQTWITTGTGTEDTPGRPVSLFACGNNTQGQMAVRQPESGSSPMLHICPAPQQVDDGQNLGWQTTSLAAGLDHCLIVRTKKADAMTYTQVCSSGLNADGQLGRPLPPSQATTAGFQSILELEFATNHSTANETCNVTAGGDTSFAWTQTVAGNLVRAWAWGNNEYNQCLLPMEEAGDQLTTPCEVTDIIANELGPDVGIRDVKIGGSWIAILDDCGRLFTAGLGATARLPPADGAIATLAQVPSLPPLSSIAASNDALMVVSACRQRLFAWGLDANAGVLGLNTWPKADDVTALSAGQSQQSSAQDPIQRIHEPVEINVNKWVGHAGNIEAVALGGEVSWVLIEDGKDPIRIWRGSENRGIVPR